MPSMLWSVARSGPFQLSPHDVADRPHLAHQLGGDRHLRHVGPLAPLHQRPVAVYVARVAQTRLRLDGRAGLAALRHVLLRLVVVRQAGEALHHGLAHRGVARLRYPAVPARLLAAVVPRGRGPEALGHAAAVAESREVVHGCHERQRAHPVDALQPGQRVDVGLEPRILGELEALAPDLVAAVEPVEHALQVELEGLVLGLHGQADRPRPPYVLPRPRQPEVSLGRALVPHGPVAQEHRRELHLEPLGRQDHVVVGAAEVAGRLRLLARYIYCLALAARRRHGLQERLRVPPVILGPLVLRAPGYARHRYYVAVDPHGTDLPRELEPARARLVDEPQRPGRPIRPGHYLLRRRAVRQPAPPRLSGRKVERRQRHRPRVPGRRYRGCVLGSQGVLLHRRPLSLFAVGSSALT